MSWESGDLSGSLAQKMSCLFFVSGMVVAGRTDGRRGGPKVLYADINLPSMLP